MNTALAPKPENMAVLHLQNMRFSWPKSSFDRTGFDLSIPEWQLPQAAQVCLTGPSGCGKTTLLNLLCGVTLAQSGIIQLMGKNLSSMTSTERDIWRSQHIGLIFQMFNLLPYATVLENILAPLFFSAQRRARVATNAKTEAYRLLSALELDPVKLAHKAVTTLSIGQQQRVAAARALIGQPRLVIADEPTSALDPVAREAFLDLLFAEAHASGAALLVVSHDERVAARFQQVQPLADLIEK